MVYYSKDMKAIGSGGDKYGGFSSNTGFGGGSGSRYGGYSSKDKDSGPPYGGSKYSGGGGSDSYKGGFDQGHYDDNRKTGSWRVEKTEETNKPQSKVFI